MLIAVTKDVEMDPGGSSQDRMHTREMQCNWYLVFIIIFPLVTGLIIKHIKLT